jgi:hypothetical protein
MLVVFPGGGEVVGDVTVKLTCGDQELEKMTGGRVDVDQVGSDEGEGSPKSL